MALLCIPALRKDAALSSPRSAAPLLWVLAGMRVLTDEHTIADCILRRKLPRGMFFHGGKSRTHALDVHILPKPYADWAENRHKSRTTIPPEKRKLIFLRHRCITGYKGAVGYYLRKAEIDRYRRRYPSDNKPTYGAENMENTKNQNTGYPGIGTKSVKSQSPAKNGNHFRNRNPVPMD